MTNLESYFIILTLVQAQEILEKRLQKCQEKEKWQRVMETEKETFTVK